MRQLSWLEIIKPSLVGRDVQIYDAGIYFRGPIAFVQIEANQLIITFEWLATRSTQCGNWTLADVELKFPLNMDLLHPEDLRMDRVIIEMSRTKSWIIFRRDGAKLESERVKGFPKGPPLELPIHLQRIIMVRHGDVDNDLNLTDQGREVIAQTAESIRSLNATSVVILSSDALRCDASAAIIAERLGLSHMIEPALSLKKANDRDFGPLYRVIQDHEVGTEILVLVTHLPMCRRFPAYYVEKRFDLRYPIVEELEAGHAIFIDATGGVSTLH